jgi:hypothetical protein
LLGVLDHSLENPQRFGDESKVPLSAAATYSEFLTVKEIVSHATHALSE